MEKLYHLSVVPFTGINSGQAEPGSSPAKPEHKKGLIEHSRKQK